MKTNTSLILTVAILALSGSALAEVKIALVAKSLGNGFFEAANVGAQEAAKELGDVKVIYTGPTTTTAEAQIEVLNGLIAQGVDAIAISANDPDAVVPVLKKAMQRGIKVVSWDSGVAPAGRQIHLNPSNNALIGETNVKLAADALKALNVEKGDVAILSATPTSTNQNIWIEEMKKVLPQYPSVNLVTVAYGDDLSDKSYREAVGLLKSYPDLKVIVSPSSVGIVAAAQAVKDQALRILAASLAQFDSDPMQAVRAVKQQAETLKALAIKTSDARMAVAAAGLEGVLSLGAPTKASLAAPIGAVLALADPGTELARAG